MLISSTSPFLLSQSVQQPQSIGCSGQHHDSFRQGCCMCNIKLAMFIKEYSSTHPISRLPFRTAFWRLFFWSPKTEALPRIDTTTKERVTKMQEENHFYIFFRVNWIHKRPVVLKNKSTQSHNATSDTYRNKPSCQELPEQLYSRWQWYFLSFHLQAPWFIETNCNSRRRRGYCWSWNNGRTLKWKNIKRPEEFCLFAIKRHVFKKTKKTEWPKDFEASFDNYFVEYSSRATNLR